jgi:hypothetical protein
MKIQRIIVCLLTSPDRIGYQMEKEMCKFGLLTYLRNSSWLGKTDDISYDEFVNVLI